jgi:hypothetical protein
MNKAYFVSFTFVHNGELYFGNASLDDLPAIGGMPQFEKMQAALADRLVASALTEENKKNNVVILNWRRFENEEAV